MFQPARPPLMWSSEAKRRAMWNGASKVVEPVAIRPICSVTIASADSSVNGSNDVTVWLRFSASIGMLSTARWSAMKKASNLPRSSVWMKRLMMREVEVGVRVGAGIAPGRGMDAGRPHEGAEAELTSGGHVSYRVHILADERGTPGMTSRPS